jgi:aspartate/methionine/tyrosine aminotransferase
MDPAQKWQPSLDELESLIKPNTRIIVLKYVPSLAQIRKQIKRKQPQTDAKIPSTPNNPTGAVLPRTHLTRIVSLAKSHNLLLLSDEVFRPLYHNPNTDPDHDHDPPMPSSGPTPSASLADHAYPHSIITGSFSKALSLPGLRLGWIATASAHLRSTLLTTRDYTTIAVSQLDQAVAGAALTIRDEILHRSLALCARNLDILDAWVAGLGERVWWAGRPAGGATAFVRVKERDGKGWVDDRVFCEKLVRETGVMVVPGGYCFGEQEQEGKEGWLRGFLRIGFVCETEVFESGLGILGDAILKLRT